MIDGVEVHPLRRISDERGSVVHMLRCDDPSFRGFGEIYFSTIYPGAIKTWHLHPRADSPTRGQLQELFSGDDQYVLVTISPDVWNSVKGLGHERAIIVNCASLSHCA